jgi:hypothetical protein
VHPHCAEKDEVERKTRLEGGFKRGQRVFDPLDFLAGMAVLPD